MAHQQTLQGRKVDIGRRTDVGLDVVAGSQVVLAVGVVAVAVETVHGRALYPRLNLGHRWQEQAGHPKAPFFLQYPELFRASFSSSLFFRHGCDSRTHPGLF